MYQTITESQFKDAFKHAGRQNNFSYEALTALYEFLEDNYENYELDIIELCCAWSEETIEVALSNYGFDSIEELEEDTIVIQLSDTILYLNY